MFVAFKDALEAQIIASFSCAQAQCRSLTYDMRKLFMRKLLAALLLLVSLPVIAQFTPGQVLTAAQLNNQFSLYVPLSGATLTGPLTVPTLTVTGTTTFSSIATSNAAITGGTISGAAIDFGAQIKSNGQNGLSIGSVNEWPYFGDQGPVFIGRYAGGSYPLTSPAAVGIGTYSLYSLNQTYAEVTGVGTWSCRFMTTGNYNVCLGMNTLGAETTGSNISAVGNDSARNENGGHDFTAVGQNSARNGRLAFDTAIGTGAMTGNGASITITGTPTAGDVISVTTSSSSPQVHNSPTIVSYTVQAGDTLASIANGLIAQWATIRLVGDQTAMQAWQSAVSGGPVTIALDFPGTTTTGWAVAVTPSVTGAATEVLTVGAGSSAQGIVAVGNNAAFGAGTTTAANSVYIGWNAAPFITSGSNNVCAGDSSCGGFTTDHDSVVLGHWAGKNAQTSYDNVLIGSQAGLNLTTGGDNVVVGGNQSGVASSCITTGNANIQIGSNACVASPTGTGQLSIQNILYGTANTGSGSNVSTGAIGIGVQVPQARLHVKGTDTSSATNAFAVTDSSGNTLFSVNDAGGVRMGYVADFTAQGGNIANTSLYSVPTNGFYCMSAHAAVTTAATTSSTLPAVTFYWTDADSGAVQLYTSSTNTGNSTGTYTQTGQVCFYAKGGTTINYQTSGYASSGATAMQYALHVRSYFGGN